MFACCRNTPWLEKNQLYTLCFCCQQIFVIKHLAGQPVNCGHTDDQMLKCFMSRNKTPYWKLFMDPWTTAFLTGRVCSFVLLHIYFPNEHLNLNEPPFLLPFLQRNFLLFFMGCDDQKASNVPGPWTPNFFSSTNYDIFGKVKAQGHR